MKYLGQNARCIAFVVSLYAPQISFANSNDSTSFELSIDAPEVNGMSYERAFDVVGRYNEIPYGMPILVTPNKEHEKTGFDLYIFDHLAVSVDASEIESNPNREIP